MIYFSSDRGFQPDLSNPQDLQAIRSNFKGYFHNSDLVQLLENPLNVGIRFYNIEHSSLAETKLIAAGARTDGFEDTSKYLRSERINTANVMNRSTASIEANPFPINMDNYMSFFSRDLLEAQFLNNPSGGISIYGTTLTDLEIGDFQNNQQIEIFNNRATTKSHLAAATGIINNEIQHLSNTSMNIISIHPCPGHCVKSGQLNNQPDRVGGGGANDPYLFDWKEQ